jgi:molybdate transport system substrate-binding protein
VRARSIVFTTVVASVALLSACSSTNSAAPQQTNARPTAPSVDSITVAAASDLRPAFDELGAAFTTATGTKVVFSYGSSGQLREQVLNGAPFDVFASANVDFVDAVIKAGRGDAATKADYALGRIVLWSPSGVTLPSQLQDVADPAYRRIAIANPAHAPYGVAAEQALQSAGVYDTVKSRLVLGENVADTFELAKTGNADVAIVALSLAIADGGPYTLIASELHKPLEQALVVTATGPRGATAAAFAAFVSSVEGRAVMVRYGFVLPGETLPAATGVSAATTKAP